MSFYLNNFFHKGMLLISDEFEHRLECGLLWSCESDLLPQHCSQHHWPQLFYPEKAHQMNGGCETLDVLGFNGRMREEGILWISLKCNTNRCNNMTLNPFRDQIHDILRPYRLDFLVGFFWIVLETRVLGLPFSKTVHAF